MLKFLSILAALFSLSATAIIANAQSAAQPSWEEYRNQKEELLYVSKEAAQIPGLLASIGSSGYVYRATVQQQQANACTVDAKKTPDVSISVECRVLKSSGRFSTMLVFTSDYSKVSELTMRTRDDLSRMAL